MYSIQFIQAPVNRNLLAMALMSEQSILATLSYFDLFDYPLSLEELHQYLYCPPAELSDVALLLDTLDSVLIAQGHVICVRGLYTLAGRGRIVDTRLDRYQSVHEKYKKAMRFSRLLAMLPCVRMVAVCNELAYGNARDESDIDLYVVTSKGYLWITRLFCSTVLELLGQRPNIATKEKKDALCLSFLASEDGLDCRSLLFDTKDGVPDIQFLYWICQIVPLYDQKDYFVKFYNANTWVTQWLPFRMSHHPHPRRTVLLSWLEKSVKYFFEGIMRMGGRFSEDIARRFQMAILPRYLKQHLNDGKRVVMNDTVMKMHPSDKREQTRELFIQRAAEIIQTSL